MGGSVGLAGIVASAAGAIVACGPGGRPGRGSAKSTAGCPIPSGVWCVGAGPISSSTTSALSRQPPRRRRPHHPTHRHHHHRPQPHHPQHPQLPRPHHTHHQHRPHHTAHINPRTQRLHDRRHCEGHPGNRPSAGCQRTQRFAEHLDRGTTESRWYEGHGWRWSSPVVPFTIRRMRSSWPSTEMKYYPTTRAMDPTSPMCLPVR